MMATKRDTSVLEEGDMAVTCLLERDVDAACFFVSRIAGKSPLLLHTLLFSTVLYRPIIAATALRQSFPGTYPV